MMNQLPNQALWHAFRDGYRFTSVHGETFEMSTYDGGTLVLPSGRIVASDPLLGPWCQPFSVRVRPGEYPVFVAVAADDVALVMVRFRRRTPKRWRTAEPDSFGVDSARGCLMDHRVMRFLRRQAQANRYDRFRRQFSDATEGPDPWASVCVDEASGANVFVFHTWGGDGRFPSFYGYDEDGRLVCLVTDLFLHHAVFEGWQAND